MTKPLTPSKATEPRPDVEISPDRMWLSVQKFNYWRVVVPAGTIKEDLHGRFAPFRLIAHMLHLGDHVQAVTADERFLFELIIVGINQVKAVGHVVQVIPLQHLDDVDEAPDGYEIRRANVDDEQPGYLCIRKEDGVVMNYGNPLLQRDQAREWLVNHQAVRAGKPQKPQVASLT